ncbi:MAG TPA: hypothetical protein DCE41_12245 [Cytophagales bacterium]|nr:hypothetical protein [Cytophagales bacterium]HAA21619.1 hypothetical protein [Cytophagales bacterium]
MRMVTNTAWVMLCIGLGFTACRPDYARQMNQLEGRWNITQSVVTTIFADGTTVEQEYEDVGYLEITPDPVDIGNDGGIKEVLFVYDDGDFAAGYDGVLVNDEDNKRLWMVRYFCPDLFNCDLGINIDEDDGRRQVWTSYFLPGSGARNLYSPGENDTHVKWTWTLRKEGL